MWVASSFSCNLIPEFYACSKIANLSIISAVVSGWKDPSGPQLVLWEGLQVLRARQAPQARSRKQGAMSTS